MKCFYETRSHGPRDQDFVGIRKNIHLQIFELGSSDEMVGSRDGLCLQGTRGSFKYIPKNALLSFCLNMKSAVHVPYVG